MKKQTKDNKESIYRIDYDKTVIFKERVTRFTVRFEFKGKEKDIVTQNKEKLRAPVKIDEDLYIESNLNSNAILNYANMIATEYELEEEIFFVLRK